MRFLKMLILIIGGVCLSGLVFVGSLYLFSGSQTDMSETTESTT